MPRDELPFSDPQEDALDLVASCACGCGENIYFGDEGIVRYDGDYFVNGEHFANWYGVERMDGIWS